MFYGAGWRRLRRAYTAGPLGYAVATLVALVWPVPGLIVNASLWVLWIRLSYHTSSDVRLRSAA